jgi:hypothetical protein
VIVLAPVHLVLSGRCYAAIVDAHDVDTATLTCWWDWMYEDGWAMGLSDDCFSIYTTYEKVEYGHAEKRWHFASECKGNC